MRVLGGRWGFLTRDIENRVILEDMDDLGGPKDHILKVLCYYLYFWWRCTNLLLTCFVKKT